MERISLRAALNVRKQMIGEVKRVEDLIRRENVKTWMEGVVQPIRDYDVQGLVHQLSEQKRKLVALKTAMCKANVGIYETLAEMEEAKADMAFMQSVTTHDGAMEEFVGYGENERKRHYDATITRKIIDDAMVKGKKLIAELQEKVDAYNINTFIEVEI